MTVKIEQGAVLPAIPGYVAGVDKTRETGELTAIRVAPAPGPVQDCLAKLNVRTIRVSVSPDVQVRPGDDVLIPQSTIRRVQPIEFPSKEDPSQLVKLFHLEPDGKTAKKNEDGSSLVWNSIQVAIKGKLGISQSRVHANQVTEIDDTQVAEAATAWAQ